MTKRTTTKKSGFAGFFRAERGMAAAEFGLLIPVFAVGLLAMLDVGIAVNERMKMDQVLRSGAQLVMTGVDDITALENAVRNASDHNAGSDGDDDNSSVDTPDYSVSITRTCECGGTAGSCTSLCSTDVPPSVFFNFGASKTMQTIFLPEFDVGSNLRIQVR